MTERVRRAKVALYGSLRPGIARDAVLAKASAQATATSESLPGGIDQRLAALIVPETLLPHQRLMASSPAPFDIAYQLSTGSDEPSAAMADAVATMWAALRSTLDADRSAVLVGQEIAITRGDGPVYNIMPLRRVPALSHEEFMHHWFDRHADLGEGVEGVRYRQNHVDSAATEALGRRLELSFPEMDGLTESYFDDVAAAIAILSQDVVAIDAIEDEKRFIHHPRSQFGLYDTVWRSDAR